MSTTNRRSRTNLFPNEPDIASQSIVCPFRILIDTREQMPWSFTGFKTDKRDGNRNIIVETERCTLITGDYSIDSYQREVAIERKSLEDLYGTLGKGRKRFERELQRMQRDMSWAAVIVEKDWEGCLRKECEWCEGKGYHTTESVLNWSEIVSVHADAEHVECRTICSACNGIGSVHPLADHSRLDPKNVYRSVAAFRVKYPAVHWIFEDSRAMAERTAFRSLEFWWKYRQNKPQQTKETSE